MKLFVWDFHGVLERGNENSVVEITNLTLDRYGYNRQMSEKEGHLLYGKRWYEYFSFLLPGLTEEEYFKLQASCFKISEEHPEIVTKHIRLNDHAEYVLKRIEESNNSQILISNTQPKFLDWFVKIVGIEKYFPSARRFAIDDSGKKMTKKECLEAFLQKSSFPDGIVSIGDSPTDMALVENVPNAVGYLYSHPGIVHRAANCKYRIHDLRSVLKQLV
jgi:phosphoglycolate phosphatase-like HAD superfamily hydrolase